MVGTGCALNPGNYVLAGLCHRAFRACDALCLRRTQTVGAVPTDPSAGRAAGLRAVSLLAIGAAADRLSRRRCAFDANHFPALQLVPAEGLWNSYERVSERARLRRFCGCFWDDAGATGKTVGVAFPSGDGD